MASLLYNNQFWKNRKKKGASHNEWLELQPATVFQLPASLCSTPECWGWYLVEFNSQGYLRNYSQLSCRMQRTTGKRGWGQMRFVTQNMGDLGSRSAVAFSKRHAFASGPHGAPNSAGTETSPHKQKQHLQLPAKFPLAHLIANWGKKNTTHPPLLKDCQSWNKEDCRFRQRIGWEFM